MGEYRGPSLSVEWYEAATDLESQAVLEIAKVIMSAVGDVTNVEPLDGAAETGYQYTIEVTED